MAGKSREPLPSVVICTDGSSRGNPGHAGWGAAFDWPEREGLQTVSGYIGETTNNVAELTAAIEALRLLQAPHRVELRSDSRWLINCATWRWRRHVHHELWQELAEVARPHKITWRWVRGHAGDPCNETAHQLAERAALMGEYPDLDFV